MSKGFLLLYGFWDCYTGHVIDDQGWNWIDQNLSGHSFCEAESICEALPLDSQWCGLDEAVVCSWGCGLRWNLWPCVAYTEQFFDIAWWHRFDYLSEEERKLDATTISFQQQAGRGGWHAQHVAPHAWEWKKMWEVQCVMDQSILW